jgi:hypothetical protein
VTPEGLKHEFESRVRGIGHIVSMLFPWDAPINLTRIWCAVVCTAVLRGVVVHACCTAQVRVRAVDRCDDGRVQARRDHAAV